jgi:ubiquinone/menaquinone biosynthesis C-methylase UbiE
MRVPATTREWQTLALDDPLYAVAAWPGREDHGWQIDEFYATGEADWASFVPHWQQYVQSELRGTCIEIGCGAGRITRQLAKQFDTVYAVDVSERMLELAHKAAPTASTVVTDGRRLPLADACADAVFSCHVLQHLENAAAVQATLLDVKRCLRPGGTAMIHLLLRQRDDNLARVVYREAKLRWTRVRSANRGAYSRVRRYFPADVREMFDHAEFRNVELHEFRAGSNDDPHAFWLATA